MTSVRSVLSSQEVKIQTQLNPGEYSNFRGLMKLFVFFGFRGAEVLIVTDKS